MACAVSSDVRFKEGAPHIIPLAVRLKDAVYRTDTCSAHNLGAAFIFTVGQRYKYQASDNTKAWC